MALPGTETIRFRRPTSGPNAVSVTPSEPQKDQFGSLVPSGWKRRHQGLLQDKVGRQKKGPMIPSLSLAIRLLLLVRTAGAMYSIISDCDEVFNFFEPLHYFQHNSGFQTWELSPQFAIRSWSYILLHWPLAHLGPKLMRLGKREQFFALRISLGFISSFCEAKFYRTVVDSVNERVGRYLLFAMIMSAGMWSASVAFLPSTFTMYTTMLAFSYAYHPATSTATGVSRAIKATALIAFGAIAGWPFSAALGVPFVSEQVFLTGGEVVSGAAKGAYTRKRLDTMIKAVSLGAAIAIPVYLIDSWAYGRSTLPNLNIVLYNVFSSTGGPDLYGTSPFSYYFANLFLNFNFLLPLAVLSLPALAITYKYDKRRLGKTQQAPKEGETSPYTLLMIRLLPFYIWLGVLSLQAHKEERFFFPAYPLLCFNAAVMVYLMKGWAETYYIHLTNSPYEASRTSIFSNFSLLAILVPGLISVLRIISIHKFYHAPLDVAHHFQYHTISSILESQGYQPVPLPKNFVPYRNETPEPEWDFSPLLTMEPKVKLCYAGEWYRFPGSYLIPDGIEVAWVDDGFDGMMPRQWVPSRGTGIWPRDETRVIRSGRFNGENKESKEGGGFVSEAECDYLVDLRLPSDGEGGMRVGWEEEFCKPFLDGKGSKWWGRLVWLPWGVGAGGRQWGDYCLLRRK